VRVVVAMNKKSPPTLRIVLRWLFLLAFWLVVLLKTFLGFLLTGQ